MTPLAQKLLAARPETILDAQARHDQLAEVLGEVVEALEAVIAVQDADPDEHGLMDAFDSDGIVYQSAHLGGLLEAARAALSRAHALAEGAGE